jgi:tetratricopeptide (TPR) repeat protein
MSGRRIVCSGPCRKSGARLLAALVLICLTLPGPAMAIDLAPLWDFNDPELSEQRFRAALQTATPDDALVLQTQIARTYGLRKNFVEAQAILRSIEPKIAAAGPEAQTRYYLELGRTFASAAHTPESQTPEARETARAAYGRALEVAKAAGLDSLAIDALHMFAFVDTTPQDQLKWGLEALGIVESSTQPQAVKWEASIRNNIGYALHQLGRYPEALAQFQQAVVIREREADAESTRAAHWMVAWTLRALDRPDEALEIQLRLEQECEAAGQPDPYVFEELEILYRAEGNLDRAGHYERLRKELASGADGR